MQQKQRTTQKFFLGALFTVFSVPFLAFAYQAAPNAVTIPPTFITEKSAKFNGKVNANEMPDTYQWFEWGVSGRSDVYQTPHYASWWGAQQFDTSADVVGLAPSTQYFYRQVAENSRGKHVGQTVYFTTKPLSNPTPPLVIVETEAPVLVTQGSATLKGYISPHGGAGTLWWFEWGTTNQMENETPHTGWGVDSGVVQIPINGLLPGTTYFFRLVGQNGNGQVFGATKIFTTLGTPPPPSEVPRAQNIPTPERTSDGISRKVTTNGSAAAQATNPWVSADNRPGDILGMLFGGRKQSTKTSATGSAALNAQGASVGNAGSLGSFWGSLTGKKNVEVVIEKVGPKSVPPHTAVEYRVSYAYRLSEIATDAKLKVILPGDVVYIGDNTTNEFLLEEGAGPERTYVLPIARLENGSTRTISMLGMTTGDAKGFPDARARLEYTDARGAPQVVAAGSGTLSASKQSAAAGNGEGGILPHSLLGWLAYIGLIAAAIFGVRKALAYYDKRKEEILLREEEARRANERVHEAPPPPPHTNTNTHALEAMGIELPV